MRCVRSPSFYNTLTTNCTTNIGINTHVDAGRVPVSWKILASGHVPEYLYEQGGSAWERVNDRLRSTLNVDYEVDFALSRPRRATPGCKES